MAQERGTYALLLVLPDETAITVGRLGAVAFPAGYYLYIGSGHSGLFQRVWRHLQPEKKLRWHIDYLRPWADVIEVWYLISEQALECLWARAALAMPQARIPLPGFGSSDCRCRSHLVYYHSPPAFELFHDKLGPHRGGGVTEMHRLFLSCQSL